MTRIFVKVIQHGSFSKAAELLGVPKSTVSKSVSKLEKITGTKLLLRTTRSQTLTAAGRLFYETCLEPIQVLEDAQKSLYGQDSIVSGPIKITSPEDIGSLIISPLIGSLSKQHPDVSFELHYTNEIVDLIKEGFDLAVRIGHLAESNLKVRRIGILDLILVASSSYLKNYPPLKEPKDLKDHLCLLLSDSQMKHYWTLTHGKKNMRVEVHSKVMSNQMSSLLQVAIAGGGITLASSFLCQDYIKNKGLERVLPDWKVKGIPISLVSPLSTTSSARLKLVSDEIHSAISSALTLNF
ncbi:MAG: LysR family transcriptional regulator [Bdellovibrionales bacterium]|nr:LysR family transcriptional regulator [Bdellovibrionales bacterium]